MMFQDDVSLSVPNFEWVQSLRENEVPLLLAFHLWDRVEIVARLEALVADSGQLGAFYESFFAETWDGAPAAMLEACRFLQAGLARLTEDQSWLLIFVS